MKVRFLKWAVLAVVAFAVIGGSCGPPEAYTCGRCPQVCDRPTGGAPYVEEVSALVRITNRPSHDCDPDLSPDGKLLAFESWDPENCYDVPVRNHRAGDFDVWVVGANGGGGYQRVTRNSTDDYYPAWYPDGKIKNASGNQRNSSAMAKYPEDFHHSKNWLHGCGNPYSCGNLFSSPSQYWGF